jgi:molybdate transport system regulatory protein
MASQWQVRIKVWLADAEGAVVIGPGRTRLLEGIERTGSILKAAQSLKMSYRRAWGRLKVMEERLGEPLLERQPGAGRRGGTRLTPKGKALLALYQKLTREMQKTSQTALSRLAKRGD